MISVLSGPNLTLELSTIGLLKKTSFFLVVLRPPQKKLVFLSSSFGESSKVRLDPERTDIILLKWIQRDLISAATEKKTKLKLQKTKAEKLKS